MINLEQPDTAEKETIPKFDFPLIWKLVTFEPVLLVISILGALATSLLVLAPGRLAQMYYDTLSLHAHGHSLQWIIGVLLVVPLCGAAFGFVKVMSDVNFGTSITSLLRINLFERILRSDTATQKEGAGFVLTLLRDDAGLVSSYAFTAINVVAKTVTTAVAVCILLQTSAKLTLLAFFPLVTLFVVAQTSTRKFLSRNRASRRATTDLITFVTEVFGAVQTIQLSGAHEHVVQQFRDVNVSRRSAMLKERLFLGLVTSLLGSVSSMGMGIIMLAAGWFLTSQAFTIGDLELFANYLGTVLGFSTVLGELLVQHNRVQVALERLAISARTGTYTERDLFAHRPVYLSGLLPISEPTTKSLEPFRSLQVSNFTCMYPGSRRGIREVNFYLHAGSITVITGEMGAGKTTLINALLGRLPCQSGTVYWNDHLIDSLSDHFQPPRLAYTPQQIHLFSGTWEENILLGSHRGEQTLSRAIYVAGLERDLADKQEGIATQIGARGMALSGGQRQRLALARMFVTGAQIFVLDDPTSALDIDMEKIICERFLASRESTLLIATTSQRLLRVADNILIMEKGQIADQGSYEELLPRSCFLQMLAQSVQASPL